MKSVIFKWLENRRTLFGVLALVVLILFVSDLNAYDLWWHLRAGEDIVRTGRVPRVDPFSFTAAGNPWTYHSWLAGVAFYAVHALGGVGGLVMLRAVLTATSLLLAWAAARKRGVGAALASILVLAAAYQLKTRALTRPFLFSFVLLMVFYILLQGAFERSGSRGQTRAGRLGRERWFLWGGGGRLILLPCLMLLWANLHAGFLVGLLAIGAFGAAEMVTLAARNGAVPYARKLITGAEGSRFRALLATGVLCLAASLLTPYGPGTLLYTFRLFGEVKLISAIGEWQPMRFEMPFAPFWALLGLTVLVLARSAALCRAGGGLREQAGQFCADAFLMAGFGLMAVTSVRNLAWFVLLVPPVVGYHFAGARWTAEPAARGERNAAGKRRLHVCAFYALSTVLVFQHLFGGGFGLGVSEKRLPVGACDYLDRAPLKGRLYNVYEWGGYLIWRFWPDRKVFIDGRCLVYRDRGIRRAVSVARGNEGWQEILEEQGVKVILVPSHGRDNAHFFRSGRWHCVYWDDTALVAVRDPVPWADLPGVEHFELSNPAMFDERLEDTHPAAVLAEVDRVLARRPECWTAWTFRARCLLKMAQQGGKQEGRQLAQALEAALGALEINDRRPETWRALAECYQAAGRQKESRRALRRARKLERSSP